jgi:hypothetical protein
MLNQETRAHLLYVHDADHTRRYLTSRSADHRVLELYDHPDPLHQLSNFYHDPHVIPHLPATNHDTKNRILQTNRTNKLNLLTMSLTSDHNPKKNSGSVRRA